jgi:hypothetical protein
VPHVLAHVATWLVACLITIFPDPPFEFYVTTYVFMEKRHPYPKNCDVTVGIKDRENNGFADDNFYKFTCSVY